MKRTGVIAVLAAALLAGCSRSDQEQAKQKAREASQDLKRDAQHLKDNPKVREAGKELHRDLKQAETKAKQGYAEANREISKGLNGADRDLRKKTTEK
jgi:hypothetical protein